MAQSAQIQKVSHWHEAISNFIIARPGSRNHELAAAFGMTESWMSTITNSDAFKQYHAERVQAHQGRLSKSVIEKVEDLAHLSVDVLEERIQSERDKIGLGLVRETADMALKACGYGGKHTPAVQVNLSVVDPSTLARAREKMRSVTLDNKEEPELLAPV